MRTDQRESNRIIGLALLLAAAANSAFADGVAQTLPFTQNWTNTGLITVNNDWSGVPGIIGYRSNDYTSATGIDPRTILTLNPGSGTIEVNVAANQNNPVSFVTGGVTEFELSGNPTIGMAGSNAADVIFLLLHLNTTGKTSVRVTMNVRDLDSSADNAAQSLVVQYRVGDTGDFTNVAYVSDGTEQNAASLVTPIDVTLPANADNAGLVQVRIMTTNAAGNDEPLGIDDINITGQDLGGTSLDVTPDTLPGGVVGVAYSQVITATGGTGVCSFSTSGNPPAGLSLGTPVSNSMTLEGTPTTAETASFTINATCENGSGSQSYTVSIAPPPLTCGGAGTTLISEIQGAGDAGPFTGQVRTIEGVVTRLIVGTVGGGAGRVGFFVQQPAGTEDQDPATSEGIFVDYLGTGFNPSPGDLVRIQGTVSEQFGMTRLQNPSGFAICGSGTVTAAPLSLPLPAGTSFERYEGMRVSITQLLTVTGNENLGAFGELRLATTRLYQPTQLYLPGSPEAAQQIEMIGRSGIILDDGSQLSNHNLPGYLYPEPNGLRADHTVRAGDVLSSGIEGVLEYAFSEYRIHPVAAVTFGQPENPRPAAPGTLGGRLRIAGWNVLNYFTSFGGSNRGADDAAEFQRQKDKISAAVAGINPDVLGITELQNNGAAALNDLLTALNEPVPGKYAGITGAGSTDLIQNAILYQPARVTPVGAVLVKTFSNATNRPALAQIFQPASGPAPELQRFAVVVNHLRSKGSACGVGNDDAQQGNCNLTRTMAANELLAWVSATLAPSLGSNPKILMLGDYNAYRLEDPVRALISGGFYNLADIFGGANAYSYIFAGQSGTLDYAFASSAAERLSTGAVEWHIDSDEPEALDYNVDGKINNSAIDLYDPDAYRASDHDPILVGFNPLCGDLNDDGQVNAADQALFQAKLGQPVANVDRRMDFDRRDATITLLDFRAFATCLVSFSNAVQLR